MLQVFLCLYLAAIYFIIAFRTTYVNDMNSLEIIPELPNVAAPNLQFCRYDVFVKYPAVPSTTDIRRVMTSYKTRKLQSYVFNNDVICDLLPA